MNEHRITFSMEDADIERETLTIIVTTRDSLHTVCEKISEAFNMYDCGEGLALEYREEYGWGTDGFIYYLTELHAEWHIFVEQPDATLKFIGM